MIANNTNVGQDNEMSIQLKDLSFAYRQTLNGPTILKEINLEIPQGQFLVLLGPSGCGKSTLLRLVAGFDQKTDGQLDMNGQPITTPGRDRGVVFQDLDTALYEWKTVEENVAFGLEISGLPPDERQRRTVEALTMVNLQNHGAKFPDQLSGGMKQRVQIARVLAMRPSVMLMDEPFASLDAQTRAMLQKQIVSIWQEVGGTVVYVTHDIREALNLGQRIILMSAGPNARIKHSYDVAMNYPRDPSDPSYIKMLTDITGDLEEEVLKVWS